jgi:predicted permease
VLAIFESILPIFLLVLLGAGLRHLPVLDEGLWPGLETLGYYVLFPALLFLTLAQADFAGLELGAISASAFFGVVMMFAVLAALYPFLKARGGSDSAFTSIFQTASRWNGFIALAIAEKYVGPQGLAVVALVMAVNIIPLNLVNVGVLLWFSGDERGLGRFARRLATNPLILACVAGLALNAAPFTLYPPLTETVDLIARSSLGLGLLMVGAGLKLGDALRPGFDAVLATTLKLLAMPAFMVAIALLLGLEGEPVILLAICGSVPTAMNGYVLARQLGGDAEFYAAITTLQTALAVFTMPAALALAAQAASG